MTDAAAETLGGREMEPLCVNRQYSLLTAQKSTAICSKLHLDIVKCTTASDMNRKKNPCSAPPSQCCADPNPDTFPAGPGDLQAGVASHKTPLEETTVALGLRLSAHL